MKRTLLSLLAAALLACSSAKTQPAPQVPAPPPPVAETKLMGPPAHPETGFSTDVWWLDVDIHDWTFSYPTDQSIWLVSKDEKVSVLIAQRPFTANVLVLVDVERAALEQNHVLMTPAEPVIAAGMTAYQMRAIMAPVVVNLTFWATGHHAVVVGCGSEQNVNPSIDKRCGDVIAHMHITEP
jgi:hypothetical protein